MGLSFNYILVLGLPFEKEFYDFCETGIDLYHLQTKNKEEWRKLLFLLFLKFLVQT